MKPPCLIAFRKKTILVHLHAYSDVFLVHTFLHSDGIGRDAEYLSITSRDAMRENTNQKNSEYGYLQCVIVQLNPFLANVPILYLLKTGKNHSCSGVFRSYKIET